MIRYLSTLMVYVIWILPVNAQKHKLDHYSIAVSNLHTNLPFKSFSSLIAKEYHPGFEMSTGFNWNEKPMHNWYQEFQLGYTYQRWVQHSICIYTSIGYRHKIAKGFTADISIGAGYLHAISDSKLFKLQHDGSYKKKFNWGRPQAMAALTIGIGKTFSNGKSIFLRYQQRLQTPFIKSYVPVLPANLLLAGVS